MIRYLPLVVGTLGGLALLANRMVTTNLTNSQSRADALGVLLSAVLILVGLLWQQAQPKPPDAVNLIGEEGLEIDEALPDAIKTELAWASHILLTNTVTKVVAVYYDRKTILRRGIFGTSNQVNIGTIAQIGIGGRKNSRAAENGFLKKEHNPGYNGSSKNQHQRLLPALANDFQYKFKIHK
jgi:hypothetical protein